MKASVEAMEASVEVVEAAMEAIEVPIEASSSFHQKCRECSWPENTDQT